MFHKFERILFLYISMIYIHSPFKDFLHFYDECDKYRYIYVISQQPTLFASKPLHHFLYSSNITL